MAMFPRSPLAIRTMPVTTAAIAARVERTPSSVRIDKVQNAHQWRSVGASGAVALDCRVARGRLGRPGAGAALVSGRWLGKDKGLEGPILDSCFGATSIANLAC